MGMLAILTATLTTTTTRALLHRPPPTTTAMEQNPPTSRTRTQTKPTKSGRPPRKAATSQSSEIERVGQEGNHIHLITPTTWEGEGGGVEVWESGR